MPESTTRRAFVTAAVAGVALACEVNASAADPPKQPNDPSNLQMGKLSKENVTYLNELRAANSVARAEPNDVSTPDPAKASLPRDTAAWQSITRKLTSSLRIAPSLKDELDPAFAAIDRGFVFNKRNTDEDFRPMDVEVLLEHASLLLERVLRDRNDWLEKGVRSIVLALELREFIENDKIHEEEIAAGYYKIPYLQSDADSLAENMAQWHSEQSAQQITSVIKGFYNPDVILKQQYLSSLRAQLNGLFNCTKECEGGEFRKVEMDGRNGAIFEHLFYLTEKISMHELLTRTGTLHAQMTSLFGSAKTAKYRREGAEAKSVWDFNDITFRRRRTAVARDLADLKTKAVSDVGGLLNYEEMRESIRSRVEHDLRELLARIVAAGRGLELLFGYKEPLPLRGENSEAVGTHVIDRSALWVRQATSWLARVSRLDQNYVFPISLRKQLSAKDWGGGLGTGKWTLTIPEELFPDQAHVRLRGIGAYVRSTTADTGTWNLVIRPPKSGLYRHLSGQIFTFDQQRLPPVRLSRVGERGGNRESDVSGVSALHNSSPIGEWTVEMSESSLEGYSRGKLADVQIDLLLAVRQKY